jgi:hypothetical protein
MEEGSGGGDMSAHDQLGSDIRRRALDDVEIERLTGWQRLGFAVALLAVVPLGIFAASVI